MNVHGKPAVLRKKYAFIVCSLISSVHSPAPGYTTLRTAWYHYEGRECFSLVRCFESNTKIAAWFASINLKLFNIIRIVDNDKKYPENLTRFVRKVMSDSVNALED